ncbi:hypothetical protein JHK87_002742 [Glycine soja]|nr:hypothetical protein JHK87_002742 [Glycine soja]
MPAARAFPLGKLMDSLQDYQSKSLQKIFIEYIMLDGVNDEEHHAHQLGKLSRDISSGCELNAFQLYWYLESVQTYQ